MGSKAPKIPKTRDRRISSLSDREGFLPINQKKRVMQFIKENKQEILKGEKGKFQKIPRKTLIDKMNKKKKVKAQELFKLRNNEALDLNRSVLFFPDPNKEVIKTFIQYSGKERALGFGGFGKVKMGEDLDTGERVAIKTVYFTEAEFNRFQSEVDHSKKAGLVKYAMHRKKDEKGSLIKGHIILPLGEACLNKYCGENGPGIKTFGEKLKLSLSALKDLNRLHDLGILHRDVKPGNILLDSINHEAHLVDFGLAQAMSQAERQEGVKLPDPAGTYEYVAPEVFKKDRNYQNTYSEKSDIFGMGETFKWLKLNGPHADADKGTINDTQRLVDQMTQDDPRERPQDEEAIIALLKIQKNHLIMEYAEKEKKPGANRKMLRKQSNSELNEIDRQITEYQTKLKKRNYQWSQTSIQGHFKTALEFNPNTMFAFRSKAKIKKAVQKAEFNLLQKLHELYKRETQGFKNEPSTILLEACERTALRIREDLRNAKVSSKHILFQSVEVILKDFRNLQTKNPLMKVNLEVKAKEQPTFKVGPGPLSIGGTAAAATSGLVSKPGMDPSTKMNEKILKDPRLEEKVQKYLKELYQDEMEVKKLKDTVDISPKLNVDNSRKPKNR